MGLFNCIWYQINLSCHIFNVAVGNACRFKVIGWLKKKFESPREAELHYGISGNQHRSVTVQTDPSLLHHTEDVASSTCVTVSCGVQTDFPQQQLSPDCSMEYLSTIFAQVCEKKRGVKVPEDFLVLASSAIHRLSEKGRSNILYSLAKGIGTMREDGSDSRFPTQRMPMGLVEYTANFFVADDLNQVLLTYFVLLFLFIVIFHPDSKLSSRLSPVAANNVLPVRSEMGKTSSWPYVVCCSICICS